MPHVKLTEEIAADIKARVKSLDFKTVEKLRKAKDDNGTFDVIISTEDTDRSGEIVKQNGWELANYKNNPIVLWGHDYYSLPIGVCTETYLTEHNGVPALGAKGVFLSAEINSYAQQVRKLYDFGMAQGGGVGCTTSVGFIPKEFDENARNTITKAELLEFSFVPIPANQGVGPARGRALTVTEVRELQLDTQALVKKGFTFEEKAEEPKEKEAQAGDSCSMDDGSAGVLAADPKDPDGALVCVPSEGDKGEKAHGPQKAFIKALHEEHARHEGEVERAFDDFREKAAVVEDQGDPEDANEGKKAEKSGNSEAMRECLKDLRDAIRDEHGMHRSKSIAIFRSFEPEGAKAFDKKEHLKALRNEHDAYETKNNKTLDEFEERCMKSVQGMPGEQDEHTDWITGKMEEGQRVHKKAVTKIAKAMCKSAFGEEEEPDEKTVEIVKEFLVAHVDAQLLPAVAGKIAGRITALNRERLSEAHSQLKAAIAVVEALHGGLGDSDGEESRSDAVETVATAPEKKRSRPARAANTDDELQSHMFAREVLREITTVATSGLERINKDRKAKA